MKGFAIPLNQNGKTRLKTEDFEKMHPKASDVIFQNEPLGTHLGSRWDTFGAPRLPKGCPKGFQAAQGAAKGTPRGPHGSPFGTLGLSKVHQISHFGAQESPSCLILCMFAFFPHDLVANLVLSLFLDIF